MDDGDKFEFYECHMKNGCSRVIKDHKSNEMADNMILPQDVSFH